MGDNAYVQVFDSTRGLKIGEKVEFEGHMLEATLAPGLLSRNYDGLQNDLEKMDGLFIARGSITDPIDFEKKWEFKPLAKPGDKVSAASWLGPAGEYKVTDTIAVITDADGRDHDITMVQRWPVKQAVRCYREKPRPSRVMETGVRAIDTFNPLAEGGTGFIPGPFGAGKTVLQHAISKQADADVIIIVACGVPTRWSRFSKSSPSWSIPARATSSWNVPSSSAILRTCPSRRVRRPFIRV